MSTIVSFKQNFSHIKSKTGPVNFRVISDYFFFYLAFKARQDYFTHFGFEQSQSLGGLESGDPREKTPDHPQAEISLSHVTRARLDPTVLR